MMFYSRVYRFTFVDWPFFGCMTVTSFVTLISSTVFAFVCLRNYDKGLAQWSTYSLAFRRDVQNTDLVTSHQYTWNRGLGKTTLILTCSLPR